VSAARPNPKEAVGIRTAKAHVNYNILMARVARRIDDKRVLKLIRACLNAGVMTGGVVVRTEEGTPQGGPLSPLLANILPDDLDKELIKRGLRFVRYADDCNIFVASKRAGERIMESVIRVVEGKLRLKVNRDKSAVNRPWNASSSASAFCRTGRPRSVWLPGRFSVSGRKSGRSRPARAR